jgi:glutamyl-tRNA reductase
VSLLVVGVSHHTASVELLERLALDQDGVEKLVATVLHSDHVLEATVLATCNRVEVYAEVTRFHDSVDVVTRALCDHAEQPADDVIPHLYVHYDDGAVSHLFHVAAGLDSMVVGEGQVLGQTREALRIGQDLGAVGPGLNAAFQQALRVAKRTHAETGVDRAAPSLVSVSLDRAAAHVGQLAGRRAVVVGAGAMASLAVATLSRLDLGEIVVVNRTPAKAARLAEQYAATIALIADLPEVVADADVLISCTGSIGLVLTTEQVAGARGETAGPLAVIDLALPHDIEPSVAELPGVGLVSLKVLAEELSELDPERAGDILDVRRIVAEEIQAFLHLRHLANVTPTVVALRSMATGVVEAELARLEARLPELPPELRAEVELAIRRVADKLMHQPTVRVKELANTTGAISYTAALAELFSLDPQTVDAVTRAEGVVP